MRNLLSQLTSAGGTQDDANVINMIQGVFGQVIGVLNGRSGDGGGQVQGTRISQFLDSLPDYNYVAGESLITDLLHTIGSHLTFSDMIQLVMDRTSPTASNINNRLQHPLRQFFFSRILNVPDTPSSASPSEVESGVQLFMDSFYPDIAEMARIVNSRPDVDMAETMYNFFRSAMIQEVRVILDTPNENFGSVAMDLSQRLTGEFVALVSHCSTDDIASMERLVENRLAQINEQVGHLVRRWITSSALGHFRNYIAGLELNTESITSYIVTPQQGEEARRARVLRRVEEEDTPPPPPLVPGATAAAVNTTAARTTSPQDDVPSQDDDDAFETPRSSPELMETEERSSVVPSPLAPQDKAEAGSGGMHGAYTVPPPVNEADLRFPSALLPRSGMGPDMVVGGENWHRALPADWVPVIARDSQTQAPGGSANMEQGPFSDAYLTTQPAKRRKLAASQKPEGSMEQVIAETIQDAVQSSGVRPMLGATGAATLSDMSREVARDVNLQLGVEREAVSALKRRIKSDPDIKDEKHPNVKDFVKK